MAPLVASLFGLDRPPTPPTRHAEISSFIDDAIRSLDTSFSSPISNSNSDINFNILPNDDTPPSSSPLRSQTHGPPRKKLRFSVETSVCRSTPSPTSSISGVPSNHIGQGRFKSILKPSASRRRNTPPIASKSKPSSNTINNSASFLDMLHNVVKILENTDNLSRRDAYHALSGWLRSHKHEPQQSNILADLSLLETCLERDIAAVALDAFDSKVSEQALQCVFNLMLRVPQQLTVTFRAFVLDQCIGALERSDVSKEAIKHQLNLLTIESSYNKPMTQERAKRILKGLANIDKFYDGQSILQLRIIVYQHAARHYPLIFLDDIRSHIRHVFNALCSSTRELRTVAIETALSLGKTIGHRQRFASAVSILLHTKSEDGIQYFDSLRVNLDEMIQRPDDAEHVAQIWGVIMLLMRGDSKLFGKSLICKPWLMVVQACFNKPSLKTNVQAWNAWRYAIFSAWPQLIESEIVLRKLSAPVHGYLQRDGRDNRYISCRSAAYSTLYLLIYYAFGGGSNLEKMEMCWNRLLHETCRIVLDSNPMDAPKLASLLSSMLSGTGLKIWKADRALNIVDNLEEIPRLDPNWVRRNVSLILDTIALFLKAKISTTTVLKVWTDLGESLSQARQREIMPTAETKAASSAMSKFLTENFTGESLQKFRLALGNLPVSINHDLVLEQNAAAAVGTSISLDAAEGACSASKEDFHSATSNLCVGVPEADDHVQTFSMVEEQDVSSEQQEHEQHRRQVQVMGQEEQQSTNFGLESVDPDSVEDVIDQDVVERTDETGPRVLVLQKTHEQQNSDAIVDGPSLQEDHVEEATKSSLADGSDSLPMAQEGAEEPPDACEETDDEDCIVIQESGPHTPSLRELLRARGLMGGAQVKSDSLVDRLESILGEVRSSSTLDLGEIERLEDLGLDLVRDLNLLRRRSKA